MFADTDLLVGVDVHRRSNVAQVMTGQGAVLERQLRFTNNRLETTRFAHCLAERGGFEAIHVAAEATNHYWLPFFCQLAANPRLADWPLTLYPFNPRAVHHFKKALGDLEKTDEADVAVVPKASGIFMYILSPLGNVARVTYSVSSGTG